MLYIISFQSISCREASPTSPRPHKGPPEGSSARGFHRSSPQSSTRFPTRCSTRSSGRFFPSIFRPVSLTLLNSVLWPVPQNISKAAKRRSSIVPSGRVLWQDSSSVFPSIFHPVSNTLLNSVLWPVIPSIFHPVSLTLLSSVLWPVPQNNSQAGPRGGLRHGHPAHKYLRGIPAWQIRHLSSLRHGHPAHRYSSSIPTCRTIQQSLSNRPQTGPRPVLATATLSTGTPVPSPRAEQSHNLSQTGL